MWCSRGSTAGVLLALRVFMKTFREGTALCLVELERLWWCQESKCGAAWGRQEKRSMWGWCRASTGIETQWWSVQLLDYTSICFEPLRWGHAGVCAEYDVCRRQRREIKVIRSKTELEREKQVPMRLLHQDRRLRMLRCSLGVSSIRNESIGAAVQAETVWACAKQGWWKYWTKCDECGATGQISWMWWQRRIRRTGWDGGEWSAVATPEGCSWKEEAAYKNEMKLKQP